MNRGTWIFRVYQLLCKSQGKPLKRRHKDNLLYWANVIRRQCEEDAADIGFKIIGPEEAHEEEMQCL